MIVGRNMISISSRLFPYSSFPDFWFSAHTTYNVDGIITAAPMRVEIAGISPNTSAPTAALHISSVYRNGASAEASAVGEKKRVSRGVSSIGVLALYVVRVCNSCPGNSYHGTVSLTWQNILSFFPSISKNAAVFPLLVFR